MDFSDEDIMMNLTDSMVSKLFTNMRKQVSFMMARKQLTAPKPKEVQWVSYHVNNMYAILSGILLWLIITYCQTISILLDHCLNATSCLWILVHSPIFMFYY